MSVRSSVGNFEHGFNDKVSQVKNWGRTRLDNIVGTTVTGLSNIWSGGFTGMSADGMAELKTKITSYCQSVQEVISGFDQTGDITSALRGDVQDAAYDFIDAIKKLLVAYVSTLKQEIDEADEAYKNFVSSGQSIAQNVTSDASEIRSNASSISLD